MPVIRKLLVGAVVLAGIAALTRCGSEEEPAAGPEQLRPQLEELCELAVSCCQQVAPLDAADCVDILHERYTADFERLKSSGVRWNSAVAANCVAAGRALYEQCDPEGADPERVQRAQLECTGFVEGVDPPGAACETSRTCAPSAEGEVVCEMANSEGVCMVKPLVGEGDDCTTSPCERSLFCGPTNTCEPLRQLGETCNSSVQCQSQYCDQGSCRRLPWAVSCDGLRRDG